VEHRQALSSYLSKYTELSARPNPGRSRHPSFSGYGDRLSLALVKRKGTAALSYPQAPWPCWRAGSPMSASSPGCSSTSSLITCRCTASTNPYSPHCFAATGRHPRLPGQGHGRNADQGRLRGPGEAIDAALLARVGRYGRRGRRRVRLPLTALPRGHPESPFRLPLGDRLWTSVHPAPRGHRIRTARPRRHAAAPRHDPDAIWLDGVSDALAYGRRLPGTTSLRSVLHGRQCRPAWRPKTR
jgi:hypothetical protein